MMTSRCSWARIAWPFFVAPAMLLNSLAGDAAEPDWGPLEKSYHGEIRPLVERYCHECHSPRLLEAEIDLTTFATWAKVRTGVETWQKVRTMLESGQMPPKDADQPNDAERRKMTTWVRSYLAAEALARAGDPGPVLLRRLNNAEYTYTVRDLTGVAGLQPAREFPVDSAAGEGFTNTGHALVMSPALVTKYLDAAKDVAEHLVLLPDGVRFSPHATRRDWTNGVLDEIRSLYARHTVPMDGTQVALQGLVWTSKDGNRLPIETYLAALLTDRAALIAGTKSLDAIAQERDLSEKYLAALWTTLQAGEPSLLLDDLRTKWRTAKPDEATALAQDIARWQKALWKFSSVGHVGKVGGPKAWQEPVSPLTTRQDLRMKLSPPADAKEVALTLIVGDAGDGNEHDFAVWEQPRFVSPGRPDVLLRDVRTLTQELLTLRQRLFAQASAALAAAAEARMATGGIDRPTLAKKHGVDRDVLAVWLEYLGLSTDGPVKIENHFTNQLQRVSGYDFIAGWGAPETPLMVTNSSDQLVRIPGNMLPHSVAVHPSPSLRTLASWQSPAAATVRVTGVVQHAHPECGNGVTWAVDVRRGATRQRLAAGVSQGAKEVPVGPLEAVRVQPGEIISLGIGPRDGNHSCDLTRVDLVVTEAGDGGRSWSLARDVSGEILAGNPHADGFGNPAVWHFHTEVDQPGGAAESGIPAGSLLARWQVAEKSAERQQLADAVQTLVLTNAAPDTATADGQLHRQLSSLGGPLMTAARRAISARSEQKPAAPLERGADWGLEADKFGRHPQGQAIDQASLCVRAPNAISFRVPADLVAGSEFVTVGVLHGETGLEGSVQFAITSQGSPTLGLRDAPPGARSDLALVVSPGSDAARKWDAACEAFRRVFPAAACYTRIVPVDEVVTLTLYHREDDHLSRLVLDDAERARLDRLWDELRYISQDALTLVDAFEQLMEYATQDADPKVFAPLRTPIHERAAAFRQRLRDTQPAHVNAVLDFASRAWRRPLTPAETNDLRRLYAELLADELPHEEAIRLLLARVLVAPAFLYRLEQPAAGRVAVPVTAGELATRLSYFLWSSTPDDELRSLAESGQLFDRKVLVAQTRRMLRDAKSRRLATEFACQWLHIRDFADRNEKSERHFPTFAPLREAMLEESVQFFTDLFQYDGSVLAILDADYTFLNQELAQHYAIGGVTGNEWRRVDGVGMQSRGGVLTQAATLATQSGASRTSPILRGNWISEVLLGDKLPRPPKNVPVLPDDVPAELTERQLIERHSSDAACAKCHARIDPLGFALENFDAIGRYRRTDGANHAIDANAVLMDGTKLSGLVGLKHYLLTTRRDDFTRQFCRKLLGYALGRGVQLSDEPLLDELQRQLGANQYRLGGIMETIVTSDQFLKIRGREFSE